MCQEALDLERSNGKERTESKCRKDEDHDLQYGPGSPTEFRWVSMRRLSHWRGQQQHLQQLQALGAQEMQWVEMLDKGPWLQMYTMPGNCMPLGQQTAEGSPGRTWQAWGGSFLLLPRWLWKLPGWSSRTWPLTKPNLQRLQRNDRALIRQNCNVRPRDIVTTKSSELLAWLGIEDLDLILKERRLCWYGHVECSNGAVKTNFHIQVEGKRGPGRPKITWKQLTGRDCREWKLSAINPHDRHTWRSGVRSAMRAASQLSGRGSTDVDVAPVPAR